MGQYINIKANIARGYEISFLKELISRLENGETDFTMQWDYGQGKAVVNLEK